MAEDLEQEYESLRLSLSRAVERICPGWLADSRDDIAQAALIKLIGIINRSEGKREFSTFYLRRLAFSALVDEIRRMRRLREVGIRGMRTEPAETRKAFNPDSAARASEIGQGIADCLGRMARPGRIAVTLHLQGHTVPELARILRWSPKKAENLVYRGLADLRGCLASKGLHP